MRTDAELVKSCLNGQKQAFAELVNRYQRSARAVALNILGDCHSADDAAQDALVKAYQNLARLRKADAFGPWLMKITRRCALDQLRRRPEESSMEITTAEALQNPDGQLDGDNQQLLAAVIKLPKAERQVIMLRYFAGNSVKDVAEIVSRSVGTVTKQLSRAHKRLRKMLRESQL